MTPLLLLATGIAVVIGGIVILRLHAALALLLAAITVGVFTPAESVISYAKDTGKTEEAAQKLAEIPIGKRIANGFGATCGKIGILIAMAAIIGKCLLDSGGADRIVRSTLRLVGEKRAPIAFLGSGFTLGMPVFFDTVFYLMLPLAKVFTARSGGNYLLLVLAIVAGGSMAHSLVPPTPGPLVVAEAFNVEIGQMMLGGLAVGIFATGSGFIFAKWINRKNPVPLRDTPDSNLADLKIKLKSLILSYPFVVIYPTNLFTNPPHRWCNHGQPSYLRALPLQGPYINILGEKNLALVIAAIAAVLLLIYQFGFDKERLAKTFQDALSGGGVVILITASGRSIWCHPSTDRYRPLDEGTSRCSRNVYFGHPPSRIRGDGPHPLCARLGYCGHDDHCSDPSWPSRSCRTWL